MLTRRRLRPQRLPAFSLQWVKVFPFWPGRCSARWLSAVRICRTLQCPLQGKVLCKLKKLLWKAGFLGERYSVVSQQGCGSWEARVPVIPFSALRSFLPPYSVLTASFSKPQHWARDLRGGIATVPKPSHPTPSLLRAGAPGAGRRLCPAAVSSARSAGLCPLSEAQTLENPRRGGGGSHDNVPFLHPGERSCAAASGSGGCSPGAAVSAARHGEVTQPPQHPVGSCVLSSKRLFCCFSLLGANFTACRGNRGRNNICWFFAIVLVPFFYMFICKMLSRA